MFSVFRSRRMAVLFLLGFSSGLPYFLTSQTLQAWMSSVHVDLARLGAMSLIGLAYTLKWLWAPFVDRFALPLLGRRRGWMLVLQIALMIAIATMGTVDPVTQPALLAAIAATVALLSATQDVVIDAYNTDVLAPEQRAAGSAVYVTGYRVGLLAATVGAFFLTDVLAWGTIYWVMAGLLVIGIAGTFAAKEQPREPARFSLATPFVELWRKLGPRGFAHLLAFAALYEFGYFFAQTLMIEFLHHGAGFDWKEIATVYKLLAFVGLAIGGALAGSLVARFGLRRMLILFGSLAAATHLLYAVLALVGHDTFVFALAVLCDNVANAMVTAAFLSVLMGACSPVASATQFALLTSLSSVGNKLMGPFAAYLVAEVGWPGFFVATAAFAIPGILLARRI